MTFFISTAISASRCSAAFRAAAASSLAAVIWCVLSLVSRVFVGLFLHSVRGVYVLELMSLAKGFAVRWFCDYLGIPIENSVAAGDAQNDVEMLKAAHVGAVMCNAFPGIAEYGNYVTEHDNNHDGVAEIIHKFILKDA